MSEGLSILGLGTAQPPHSVAQSESVRLAVALAGDNGPEARLLPVLYRRSGVRRRASVLLDRESGQDFFLPGVSPTTGQRMRRYERESTPLACAAAKAAMSQANIGGGEVRHLVTVSCTGFSAPGWDVALVKRLGLPVGVSRTNVGFMGCHGAFNALRVAGGLSRGQPVLVCALELCSLHLAYGADPQRMVANALFADGAAAVVVRSGADEERWKVVDHATTVVPDSEDAMTWVIGDHGFEMTLSPRVPDLIRSNIRPWLQSWLGAHRLEIPRVRSWAVHPGGPRILGAVAQALGVAPDEMGASYDVLSRCGNMSSPTVLFILERLRRAGAPCPCVALGFGPGLTAEAMLLV